jgi:hypothetical protein
MFTLKPISPDSVEGALAKAERYRLLNEPHEAESICRDILKIDPANREARISLILALTDEFPREEGVFSSAMEAIAGCKRLTIALTIPGLRGSDVRRHTTTPANWAPAATFTIGSSRPCSYSRKLSTCAPQAMMTQFCAGTPVFVFSSVTKNWGQRPTMFGNPFSRSE